MERSNNPKNLEVLHRILLNHFDFNGLRDLGFDLGISFQLLSFREKREFVKEMSTDLIKRGQLNCLVKEIKNRKPLVNNELNTLYKDIPDNPQNIKIIVVILQVVLIDNVDLFKRRIASKLDLPQDHIVMVAAPEDQDRISVLLSLPKEVSDKSDFKEAISPGYISDNLMFYPFDILDETTKNVWRKVAVEFPPIFFGNKLRPKIGWKEAVARLNNNYSQDDSSDSRFDDDQPDLVFKKIFGSLWTNRDEFSDNGSRAQELAREILKYNLNYLRSLEDYDDHKLEDFPDTKVRLRIFLKSREAIFDYDVTGPGLELEKITLINSDGLSKDVPKPDSYNTFTLSDTINRLSHRYGLGDRREGGNYYWI